MGTTTNHGDLCGRYHNARACTVRDEDCWIAYIVDGSGKLLGGLDSVLGEYDTEQESIDALRSELARRGCRGAVIAAEQVSL